MKNKRGLHVLVVEDEDLLRWVAKEVLTLSGHRVTLAPDGMAALRALETEEAFDVALLDYRLPDFDGLQLLKEIRRKHPTTAAIMMTAQGEPDLAAEAARLGVYRLIDKPFDIHELEALVREASASTPALHVAS